MSQSAPEQNTDTHLDYAKEVLETESRAILSLVDRLGSDFNAAVNAVLACSGRLIVSGMGKAGLIGEKISATLASTGTPSHYLHAAEAYHGDLGRVTADDVVLLISNSGETDEIVRLIPSLKSLGVTVIGLTATRQSALGSEADLVLELGRIEEACPLGMAPSASSTAMLALGDALALTVLRSRDFDLEQYAFYHPGGSLGRKLMKVSEVMRTGDANPVVQESTTVREALEAITRARAGAVSVVDENGCLTGIFTDGDLRRSVDGGEGIDNVAVSAWMTRNPVRIASDRLATEAMNMMKERKIDELPVVDADDRPVGMLDVQDILSAGLVLS